MGNKVIKTIKSRVSCRSYNDKKVELSKVRQIVECGVMAPTARNQQICNILVLRSKKYTDRLRELSLDVLHRDCFYGANTMILVYAGKNERMFIQDCTCILENMFIAATSLNVCSCWINQVNDLFETPEGQKVKKSLKIPSDAMIVGTCILGYSDEADQLKVKERKDFVRIL